MSWVALFLAVNPTGKEQIWLPCCDSQKDCLLTFPQLFACLFPLPVPSAQICETGDTAMKEGFFFFFIEKFHVASGYVYQSGIELMLVGFSLRQTVQQLDRLCCYKALHHTESLWRLSCDQIWTEPEREQPKKQNKTEKKIQKLVMWIYSLNQFCYTSVCVWVFKFYPIQVSRKRQMFPYNPIKYNSIMQQHLQVVCVQMCLVTDHYRGPCVCTRARACVNFIINKMNETVWALMCYF